MLQLSILNVDLHAHHGTAHGFAQAVQTQAHGGTAAQSVLESQCSKVQVIVTFLSILELMKMGHIHVEQDGLFDDISVEVQTDPDTWKNLTEFAEDEP